MTQIKKWNGRSPNNKGTWYIGATNRTHAARLYCIAAGRDSKDPFDVGRAYREIKDYFSECWGNQMEGIEPLLGVWDGGKDYRAKPIKIL